MQEMKSYYCEIFWWKVAFDTIF